MTSRPGTPAAHASSVWRRYIELPRYLRAVHGRGELVQLLGEVIAALGFERVAVVSGATHTAALGTEVAAALHPISSGPERVAANTRAETAHVAAAARDADAVLAVGGGKTIDVAKSACAAADMPLIVVPTQLTADGIASPVSVIK